MGWVIHSDLNSCYVSIELALRPTLRDRPVVVGGSEESRHGIVLAKNLIAKRYGIKTGNSLVDARRACPDLVTLPPNYPLYLQVSKHAKSIYSEYASATQSFGIDEAWADISCLASNGKQALMIAEEIRNRIHKELGVTVSIGISWNKIYAKLGSDYRKPDVCTLITRENYRDIVFPLPTSDLLYVGPATTGRLNRFVIRSIGDIVEAGPKRIRQIMNSKVGEAIWTFASGNDITPVTENGDADIIKSVGNSNTFCRSLENVDDVKMAFWILGDSVASRLRDCGLEATTVAIYLRNDDLTSCTRQRKLPRPTSLACELVPAAVELLKDSYDWRRPLRSVGIKGADLVVAGTGQQLSMFMSEEQRDRRIRKEQTVDYLRKRFGYFSVQRAALLTQGDINHDAKGDNVIHPVSYLYTT